MDIQVSLDLFQGSKLSFHHFDGGNKNVVVGKGYVGGPKLFFLRILRIDKRWKISTLAYLIWLELSKYQIVNI